MNFSIQIYSLQIFGLKKKLGLKGILRMKCKFKVNV